jgi:hypothetical protein
MDRFLAWCACILRRISSRIRTALTTFDGQITPGDHHPARRGAHGCEAQIAFGQVDALVGANSPADDPE